MQITSPVPEDLEPRMSPQSPQVQKADESKSAAKLAGIKAAYELLAKSPMGPAQTFVSLAPITVKRDPFKSPGQPRSTSPAPVHRGKAKFTKAAKQIGAVMGMAREFSQGKREENRKRSKEDQGPQVLLPQSST